MKKIDIGQFFQKDFSSFYMSFPYLLEEPSQDTHTEKDDQGTDGGSRAS